LLSFKIDLIAVALRVAQNTDDAVERTRQQRRPLGLARCDDERAVFGRQANRRDQSLAVRRVRGAQAEIDDVRAGRGCPFDRQRERFSVRREVPMKQLHRNQLRVRCFLVDRRRDRGSVSDPVDRVVAFVRERLAGQNGSAIEMRMLGVDPAVEHRDRDAAPGSAGERRIAQSVPHDQ
jgi:hypothetical protein